MRVELRKRSWLRHFTLLVICFFVLMLGYALYKLTQLQSDLGRDTGENMVWALSQSSYQTGRLLLAMADAESSAEDVERLQAMVVASVRLLTQGRPRDFMQQAGVWPDVQRAQQALEAEAVDYLALQREFQRIGGLIMVTERNQTGGQRDTQRHVVMQIMMASLGMLLAGMMLCCQLFLSLTHARAARLEISRQHAQTKALLSTLQRERSVRLRYRDFVSLMSHQLRTPLAVIDSSAQRLLRRNTHELQDIGQRSQRIRAAVSQLNRLIERVLDGMRGDEDGEGERSSLCRSRCYWRDVIDDVLERLGDTLGGRQVVRYGEDLWVICDRMWCVEILVNLISNAHKYSPETAPIEVVTEVRGQVLHCTVRDFGQGIAAEDRLRIFERFYRGEQTTRSNGLGLGLPIARMLAQWQGGGVSLADDDGAGTAFTLLLPLVGQSVQRAAAENTQLTL
ncbi:sensor histidine kinase [Pseudomonas sp. o96-267]|uniref:sensor histidine kinase n=1 Tax=Pseudomonas sp. o96-267 TaxID=2479853 RepID=UPI000F79F829|nr:HAMP domain-containing sensor histidine kinase [Pseudomonas sp. o96-267]RRV26242.1 sensor histidine kinase [Pseudomonas sp. o96-267]